VNETIVVALISTSGSVAVAVTALLLTFRLFNSLERRIEVIEADLKSFFKDLGEHDKRITRLENR